MHTLRIGVIVVLALWMGFITWRVEEARTASQAACAFALSAATRAGDKVSNYQRGQLCPWWVVTFKDPIPPKVVTLEKLGRHDANGWHAPSTGLVADGQTAIRVAQVYIGPLVPAENAANLSNWTAHLDDRGRWVVGLSDPNCGPGPCTGGGWVVLINKTDGHIEDIYAGQ